MDSLTQLTYYIAEYGYLTIFALVFLQQIGVPNPITNELVLIFCGYLSYSGTLNFWKAILAAAAADIVGSLMLFFVFYTFGKWVIDHSPKWVPISGDRIERMKARVLKNGYRGMFFARITPIVRGYVALVAGMLNINRKGFISLVIGTAIVWNGILVLIGLLAGPYWSSFKDKTGMLGTVIMIVVLILLITYAGRFLLKKQEEKV